MNKRGIECRCCLIEKDITKYHKIETLVGNRIIRSMVIKDMCIDCLDIEDVSIVFDVGEVRYNIKNMAKYNEKFVKNYCKLILKIDLNDYYTMTECANIEGYEKFGKDLVRNARKHYQRKSQKVFFEMVGVKASITNKSMITYYIKKEDFHKYLDLSREGHYTSSKMINNLPSEKIKKLLKTKWIKKINGKYFTFIKHKNDEKLCKWCGNVKSMQNFREYKNGRIHAYQCNDCASKLRIKKWKNLTKGQKNEQIDKNKKWAKNNPDKIKKYRRAPKYKIARNLRTRLRKFMKESPNSHYAKDIGCTKQEFIKYIESKFEKGMAWENYGNPNGDHTDCWHLDHIIPLSKFKGKYPNHYTNIQPMWGLENISKNAQIDESLSPFGIDNWIRGFVFGQHIYTVSNGKKEMLISIPNYNSATRFLESVFSEKSYNKGDRKIIRLNGDKLDIILNKWDHVDTSIDFMIGLIESNFDIFVERVMDGHKVLKTRQYIKLSNHLIIKRALDKLKIKYSAASKSSIKITKKIDCAKFLKNFDINRFLIYRDEIVEKCPYNSI